MHIVYAQDNAPISYNKSIFLAGPSPRVKGDPSWRPEALRLLEEAGYDGVVFVPDPREWQGKSAVTFYNNQISWEDACLNMADCILFWVDRELEKMPGFTTNVEFGRWENSGKVVFGAPENAPHTSYLFHYAKSLYVPTANTLKGTIDLAITKLDKGEHRIGGEREVQLHIWKTLNFQDWYNNVKNAGNRLDGAKLVWNFTTKKGKFVYVWALLVNVFITKENRSKMHEIVISRRDIACALLYYPNEILSETEIVLVREFRSAVNNPSGFIWDLPSGSDYDQTKNILDVVTSECKDETGLSITFDRFQYHEARQLTATFSSFRGHLFSVALTRQELSILQAISAEGKPQGRVHRGECTCVEIVKLKDILAKSLVDWSTLGMILSVVGK